MEKDHPESVEVEVGAERAAGRRRLRAWLREAESGEAGFWGRSGFLPRGSR